MLILTARCPSGFTKADDLEVCYRIYTNNMVMGHADAEKFCMQLHPLSQLVAVDSDEKRDYLDEELSKVKRQFHLIL